MTDGGAVRLTVNGVDLGVPGTPGQPWSDSFSFDTSDAERRRRRRSHVRAEVVGVGTELLLGQIANTNAQWMSERLAEIGVDVLHHQVVGDNIRPDRRRCSALALDRADVVLVTGGLGPTEDDITRDALADLLGRPMVPSSRDRGAAAGEVRGVRPRRHAASATCGRPTSPKACARSLPVRGTAPGLVAELPGGKRIYAMPGVPAEMVEMMEGTILPELASLAGPSAIVSRTLRCAGIGESRVAEMLRDLFEASANPSVAYLASSGEVKVRLTAKAATRRRGRGADRAARRRGRRPAGGRGVHRRRRRASRQAVGRLLRDGRHVRSRAPSRSRAGGSAHG